MAETTQATIQIIGIVGVLAGLFGWLLKNVFTHYAATIDKKDSYIETLVAQGQKNTENFINTINHNQTKMNASIDRLSDAIRNSNDVQQKTNQLFEKLISNK